MGLFSLTIVSTSRRETLKQGKMAPSVPESVLKKRKRNGGWAAKKAAEATTAKSAAKAKRQDIFKRAEKYVAEYRSQEQDLIRLKREAKAKNGFYVPAEAKVIFVIRIRGINDMHPKSRKILQLLRLRQINNGVFMKVNKARIPLTDNTVIEKALGKHDIICIEDLIHEIYTCGPAFKQCSNFLFPFKLSAPLGGMTKKRLHYIHEGEYGCRDEKINTLIRSMN